MLASITDHGSLLIINLAYLWYFRHPNPGTLITGICRSSEHFRKLSGGQIVAIGIIVSVFEAVTDLYFPVPVWHTLAVKEKFPFHKTFAN